MTNSIHAGRAFPKEGVKPKRFRATVIVNAAEGILLTETRNRIVLFPGGGINLSEPPIAAAGRELFEETGLEATSLVFLFEHESQSTRHYVFLAAAQGHAKAGDDAFRVFYIRESEVESTKNMSPATRTILSKFLLDRTPQYKLLSSRISK